MTLLALMLFAYDVQFVNVGENVQKKKGFNTNWIRPGAKSIKKDGLKSHLQTNQHKEAERLEKRRKMGAEVYS